jgi:hypothetical protein
MGYPKHYVGHYPWVANWLMKNGFKVYPTEMFCQSVPVKAKKPSYNYETRKYDRYETHYLYGFVDVVALRDGKLWAFEVKSKGDKVEVALLQTKNYAECFDYSCVIADDLKKLSKLRPAFRSLGVGTYHWFKGECVLLDEPKLQLPFPVMRDDLLQRFKRYTGMLAPAKKVTVLPGVQLPLTTFDAERMGEASK